ncbi:MAG TPA: DUF2007 domain-containing protein [Gaiellaceae bacterium]|jgi:hypothetical protein
MAEATLTVVGDEIEAEALCGLLRSNGIDCYFRRTNVSAGAYGAAGSTAGPTEIVVDENDLQAARELLPKT